MPQSKDDKSLIAWLRRIQSVPGPAQTLIVAFLKVRNPVMAGRLQPILASQRMRNSILDLPVGRVFEDALSSEDSGLLPPHRDPGVESPAGRDSQAPATRPSKSRVKGERIGPWRIERLIGSGGMGSVYEAWRDDGQYEQKVALKCIRNDLFSAEMTQAFLSERSALAKLQHKGIVPLLDGGIDRQGSPWFVMRHVDGEPIDTWCDQRKTSIRGRIKLIVQACEALAYAHRQGVLHGDIKPSNILVTADREVQLVDFGLSVALTDQPATDRIGLSPAYSAPESLSGKPLAASADAYSMGAVIYRLLTGDPPSSRLLATLWDDPTRTPPALDQHALAARSGTASARKLRNKRQLAGMLKGDLSAIAARCVAPDPSQRYASIQALRDDLSAWLNRQPVAARDSGLLYKFGTRINRYRLASALIFMLVAGALAGSYFLMEKSQQAAREAESYSAMSGILEQTLGNATLSAMGGGEYSPDALLAQAEQQIRALTQDNQPNVRARGLLILARSHTTAGSYKKALALVEEAAHILPDNTDTRVEIQTTRAALTNISGDNARALSIATSALTELDAAGSDNKPLRVQLLAEIAKAQWDLGKVEDANRTLSDAILIAEKFPSPEALLELLLIRGQWNNQLMNTRPAGEALGRALELADKVSPLARAKVERALSDLYTLEGDHDRSLEMAQSQFSSTLSRLGKDHPLTGYSEISLGKAMFYSGDVAGSRTTLDQGLSVIESSYGPDHPAYAYALMLAQVPRRLAMQSFSPDINATTRKVVDMFEKRYPPGHPLVLRAKVALANGLFIQSQLEKQGPAAPLLDESQGLFEEVLSEFSRKQSPPFPGVRTKLARVLMARNTPESRVAAEQYIRENEADLSSRLPADHPLLDSNRSALAALLFEQGDLREADNLARLTVENCYRRLPSSNAHSVLNGSLILRAKIAWKLGDHALADSLLDEAQSVATKAYGPNNILVKNVMSTRSELGQKN